MVVGSARRVNRAQVVLRSTALAVALLGVLCPPIGVADSRILGPPNGGQVGIGNRWANGGGLSPPSLIDGRR